MTEVLVVQSGFDSKAQNYIKGTPSRVVHTKKVWDNSIESNVVSDPIKFLEPAEAKSTRWGVRFLGRYIDYESTIAEMRAIIVDQQSRLDEFERKRSFAPRHHKLPSDYYDNDIYLDE